MTVSFLAYTGKLTDEEYNKFIDLWYALDCSRHSILSRQHEIVSIHTIPINFQFISASFEDGMLAHNNWSKFFTQVAVNESHSNFIFVDRTVSDGDNSVAVLSGIVDSVETMIPNLSGKDYSVSYLDESGQMMTEWRSFDECFIIPVEPDVFRSMKETIEK